MDNSEPNAARLKILELTREGAGSGTANAAATTATTRSRTTTRRTTGVTNTIRKNMDYKSLPGQEDYWDGYTSSINKLKNNPDIVEFDRLCFEVFSKTEAGAKILSELTERYIIPSTPAKDMTSYSTNCVYYEGFRDCIRLLIQSTKGYSRRKEAEDAKKIKETREKNE